LRKKLLQKRPPLQRKRLPLRRLPRLKRPLPLRTLRPPRLHRKRLPRRSRAGVPGAIPTSSLSNDIGGISR
jgi:hypothetical protein